MKIIWTEPMQARLAELAADPLLSYGRIAAVMSVEFGLSFSKNACIGRAHRLNVRLRPSPIMPPGVRAMMRFWVSAE